MILITNKKKKNGKFKRIVINVICLLLLLVGLFLVFNEQIKSYLLEQKSTNFQVEHFDAAEIDKNKHSEATYDFDKVEEADLEAVLRGRFSNEPLYTVGGIAVPNVGINLPIFQGVSNTALLFGAGTMKPEQEMGKGNYGLASHRMINPALLFTPLDNTKLGDVIYLTDLTHIYEYTISFKEYVAATRVDIIEDVEGETLVTLITCDTTGTNRLAVQGEFKQKYSLDKAPQAALQAFNL